MSDDCSITGSCIQRDRMLGIVALLGIEITESLKEHVCKCFLYIDFPSSPDNVLIRFFFLACYVMLLYRRVSELCYLIAQKNILTSLFSDFQL